MRELLYVVLLGSLSGAAACGGDASPDSAMPEAPSTATPVITESTTVARGDATEGTRILFIGTSLTAGLGLDPDSAYPAVIGRLAEREGIDVAVTAAGLSGETSAGALRRVDWLLRDKVDLVVIETGANDGLRGLDPDTTAANLEKIIGRVRALHPETEVFLAQMEAPPNLGDRYTRAFRDVYMNVAREQGVKLIPFFLEGVAGEAAYNQADGIHPNAEGARRAAQNMWRTIAPVLRTPGTGRSR